MATVDVVATLDPIKDQTRCVPRHDVRKASAASVEGKIEALVDDLGNMRLEEAPICQGLSRRKIRKEELTKVLEQWRTATTELQPRVDDNQGQTNELKFKLPNVLSQDKSQIPALINRLLFHEIGIELFQERTQDLIYLLESQGFEAALELYKSNGITANQTLSSGWSSWAHKVVQFEQQFESITTAIKTQEKAKQELMPRLKHAIVTLHKTTLLSFLQACTELNKRLEKTALADRQDLQKRLSTIQDKLKALFPELDETIRALEEQLEPLREHNPVENGAMQEFCKTAALRDMYLFNPCDYITYWSYYRGYYAEAQRIAGEDIAQVAKGTLQLHETLSRMLEAICTGKKPAVSAKPLLTQCQEYVNILSTLQTRLKEHLTEKLYKSEFNPLVPRVIEYADALFEMLFHLRRVLSLIGKFSDASFVPFFEVREEVSDFFCPKAPLPALAEALSLFHAMHRLLPFKDRYERAGGELQKSIHGRFQYNTVQMLWEALAVNAPSVLTLKEKERGAFYAVISRDEAQQLPEEWLTYCVKRITNLLYLQPDGALDMEVELVLFVLHSHAEYRELFGNMFKDEKFKAVYGAYDERMRPDRLSNEVLEKACALFKLINETLVKRAPTAVAFSECRQAYSEFARIKPDTKALTELKRLAAKSLRELGIQSDFLLIIPEDGDLPLQEVARLGKEILTWPHDKLQRILLRALDAALYSRDEEEKAAGQEIINTILEWNGLQAMLGVKKKDFYTIIFENTTRKLIVREFQYITPTELALYRDEGPVNEFTTTKTHPIDDDRINDALYNIILCLEEFQLDGNWYEQKAAKPFVKKLAASMGDEGFKRWFQGKHLFALHVK